MEDWLMICEGDGEIQVQQADPIKNPNTVPRMLISWMSTQDVLHPVKVAAPKVSIGRSWTVFV